MKIVSAILALALVIVGGASIHLSRQVKAERQQIGELKAQLQERDAKLAALEAAPAAHPATSLVPAAPAAPTPAVAPASAPQPARPAPTPAASDLVAAMRAQMESPEGKAQSRELARTLVARSNPGIDEALGLSREQAEKLLDLLAEQQAGTLDVFRSSAEGNPSPQDRMAAVQEREKANEAALQAMLGSKYSQWQDYKEIRPAYQQRRDLRAVLDASGTPMTDAQGRAFIAALSVEQRSINQEMRDAARSGAPAAQILTRNTPERRQRLLDAAAPHLSPQQLEGYRGMLDRAAAQERSILAPLQGIPPAPAAEAPR